METKEIKKRELSFFKKIGKKVFLKFLDERKAIQRKIPSYLQKDPDVVEKLIALLQKPETMKELANLIDDNPWAINLLEQDYMYSYLYNSIFSKESIQFLPLEKQKDLLLKKVQYQDKFEKIEGKLQPKEKQGSNYFFRNFLSLFSSDVIIQAYIENEMHHTNLFDDFKIDELSKTLQIKLGLINNKYIKKMSIDSQIAFINNNPYLISKLGEEAIKIILQSNPQFKQFIHKNEITEECGSDNKVEDVEEIKRKIFSGLLWQEKIDISQTDKMELFKFYPDLLKDMYNDISHGKWNNENINPILQLMIDNIAKYPTQTALVEFLKQLKDGFDYNVWESKKYVDVKNMMRIAIKLVSNDDILQNVSGEILQDYIRDPKREKLLEILEKTYGGQSRRILEDRPNINIENIQNLYVFSPKAIELFSIGGIHHFLSYDYIKAPMIISDLVRYPEKMEIYIDFDRLSKEYYSETPLGLEEKLKAFSKFYDLIKVAENEGLTEQIKNNLLLYIHDVDDGGLINPINVNDLIGLQNYDQIRKEKFNEAIGKVTDVKDIKNLICEEFFGIPYHKSYGVNNAVTKENMDVMGIINFYNTDKFINDSRTLSSGEFEEDELDVIELLSIIHRIEDTNVLKEIAEKLSNTQDLIINPIIFKKIKDKIPMQYSKELVKELLTPEKAKEMAKEGKEGISFEQEDGFNIIKLTGADFLLYIHNMNLYMSKLSNLPKEEYERWTECENGVSTISGILVNQDSTNRLRTKT